MAYFNLDGALPRGEVSPGAELDWTVNFTDWLNGDGVATVVWTIPAGLTKFDETLAGGVATAWLSGFTAGVNYEVACEITSDTARVDTRRFVLQCRKR